MTLHNPKPIFDAIRTLHGKLHMAYRELVGISGRTDAQCL
jgi:hypothetical protein